MNILWYLFVCGVFFTAVLILILKQENKALRSQLTRQTAEPDFPRHFRSLKA